jgi:NAD(P)-dependent dehydrogenase (short-subunit alcohol dehydrogenase family)
MARNRKTVIVTGASQGIGAGVVKAFLARGYDVVGTARSATKSKELSASDHLALIDGDIGQSETAQKVAELAIRRFEVRIPTGAQLIINHLCRFRRNGWKSCLPVACHFYSESLKALSHASEAARIVFDCRLANDAAMMSCRELGSD